MGQTSSTQKTQSSSGQNSNGFKIILNDSLYKTSKLTFKNLPYKELHAIESKHLSLISSDPFSRKNKDVNKSSESTSELAFSTCGNETVLEYSPTKNHLANAFLAAYNHHADLELSPDDLTIAVSQIVSQYVNADPENLRSVFVDHEGKKELKVFLPVLNADMFISALAAMVDENVKTKLGDSLLNDYSTSTPVSAITSKAVLLDIFKAYFDYSCICMCGIPAVRLNGTKEDWLRFKAKYESLKELLPGLGWWYKQFDTIVELFVEMRMLQENEESSKKATQRVIDMWSRAVTYIPYGSGGDTLLTGWIMMFYPFKNDEEKTVPRFTSDLDYKVFDLKDKCPSGRGYEWQDQCRKWYSISVSNTDLPVSLTNTPVKLTYFDGRVFDVNLNAGFLACSVSDDDYNGSPIKVVKPVLGYNITGTNELKTLVHS